MEIEQDTVVAMHYKLTNPEGTVIDSSEGREPLTYLHGHRNIISGLESQLLGKLTGDKLIAEVPAADGYGEHDPALVVQASRSQFPADAELTIGMQFQANANGRTAVARITEIQGDTITVDTNHPLAGVDLTFDVEIVSVRKATPGEVDHGHVHGPDSSC
jgi:FKBP-type peptidyl-prolyl cis-trans isomerase SlyD